MAVQESSYLIEIDRHIVVLHSLENQDSDGVRAIRAEVESILGRNRIVKDVLVIQVGGTNVFDQETIQVTMEAFRDVPFQRLAIVGSYPERLILTHSMMKASGPSERFKIFRDEGLARKWLEDKHDSPRKLTIALSKSGRNGKNRKKDV